MDFNKTLNKVIFKNPAQPLNEAVKNENFRKLLTISEKHSFSALSKAILESMNKVKESLNDEDVSETLDTLYENYSKEPSFILGDNYINILSKVDFNDEAALEKTQMNNLLARFKSHFLVAKAVEDLVDENQDLNSADIEKLLDAMKMPSNMVFKYLAAHYNRQHVINPIVKNLIHTLSRINPLSQNKIDAFTSHDGRFIATAGRIPVLQLKDKKFYLVNNNLYKVNEKKKLNEALVPTAFEQEGEFSQEEQERISAFLNYFSNVVNMAKEIYLKDKDITIDLTIESPEQQEFQQNTEAGKAVQLLDSETGETLYILCSPVGCMIDPSQAEPVQLNYEALKTLSESVGINLPAAIKQMNEDEELDDIMNMDMGGEDAGAEGGDAGADSKDKEKEKEKLEERLKDIDEQLQKIDELEDGYKEDKDVQDLFLRLTGEKTVIQEAINKMNEEESKPADGEEGKEKTEDGEEDESAMESSEETITKLKEFCDDVIASYMAGQDIDPSKVEEIKKVVAESDLENKNNVPGWLDEFITDPKNEDLYNKIIGQLNEEEEEKKVEQITQDQWKELVEKTNNDPKCSVKKEESKISCTCDGKELFSYNLDNQELTSTSGIEGLLKNQTTMNESKTNPVMEERTKAVKKLLEEAGIDAEASNGVIAVEDDTDIEKIAELLDKADIAYGVYENEEMKVPYLMLEKKSNKKFSKRKVVLEEKKELKKVDNKEYILVKDKMYEGLRLPKGYVMTYNEEFDLMYGEDGTPIDKVKDDEIKEYVPTPVEELKEGDECCTDDIKGNLKYQGNVTNESFDKVYIFEDSSKETVQLTEEYCKRFLKILKK